MVIEALKAARDFIESDRQALAESLTVNGEIVFQDDTDRRAMAEYVNVPGVIDGALKVAVRPGDHCEERLDMVKERPATVQEPEIDGATMAGMDASIGHLSALVDELRILLGCAMDNFKMLHNAAKPDDGPDMDAIIPAIVFAKFVNQDAALRYAIKHSAHDGMITTPPAAQPAPVRPVQEPTVEENSQDWAGMDGATAWLLINRHADGWADVEKMMGEWLAANTPPAPPAAPMPLTDDQVDAATKAWFENDIVAGRYPFRKRMRAAFAAAHGITGKGQP